MAQIVSQNDLEEIFVQEFPSEIQKALLKCLFNSYHVAYEQCEHFQHEEARDLRGFYRWVQLRAEMRGLGDRYAMITATAEPYHTLLSSSRIKLIACSNREPNDQIRPAIYRHDYAIKSQLDLYPVDIDLDAGDSYILAILIHGVDHMNQRQPAFAKVVFPTQGLQSYIHEINLFRRYSELVDSLKIPSTEDFESFPKIMLHPAKKEVDN